MSENGPLTPTRRSGRLWASRGAKLVLFLAVIVAIAWASRAAAVLIYNECSGEFDLSGLGAIAGTVLGVSLGFIKTTGVVLGRLVRWIAAPGWRGFLPHVSVFSLMVPLTLASIAFSLALVLLVLDGEDDELQFEEQIKTAMEAQGYTTRRAGLVDRLVWLPRERNAPDGRRFPIMFERGQIAEDDNSILALTDDVSDVRFSAGLGFAAPRDRSLIATLVRALAPCGASGTGTGRPVVLRVEGYASSEPFERAEGDLSRRLNVHLANERRRVVESELRAEARRLGVGGAIRVPEGEDYTVIAEMEEHRRFNDRPGDSSARGEYEQDFFTRAAHVLIEDLSACSYEGS